MRMFSAVVAMSMVLSACSGGDAGNDAAMAEGNEASPGTASTETAKVEPVMDEAQRKAYADLFGCRFQLRTMETGSIEVDDGLSDEVTAELESNPGAVAECLRTLESRRQRYGPPPGAAPAPETSQTSQTPDARSVPAPR